MSKVDKKRAKLQERITTLEGFLNTSLGKKTSATAEIDVPGTLRQIADLKKQMEAL